MKIYTRFGDLGETKLLGGSVVNKNAVRVDTYGTIDEVSSSIGIVHAHLLDFPQQLGAQTAQIQEIQNDLFALGSLLACEDLDMRKKLSPLSPARVSQMESHIDEMTTQMPVLKNFILPGAHKVSSFAHLSRSICRRAERQMTAQDFSGEEKQNYLPYINRLSDYLFTLARFVDFKLGATEVIWKSK